MLTMIAIALLSTSPAKNAKSADPSMVKAKKSRTVVPVEEKHGAFCIESRGHATNCTRAKELYDLTKPITCTVSIKDAKVASVVCENK